MVGEKSKLVQQQQNRVELLYRLLCAAGLGAVTGAAAGYAAAAAAGEAGRLQCEAATAIHVSSRGLNMDTCTLLY